MKRNFFNKNLNVYLTKRFSSKTNTDRYVKIENFYEFMDENIKIKEKKYENKRIDDEKVLLSVVKCPMTNSNLEASEEGLKVGHILYPKKNGIYYLNEEDVIFKF